MLNVLSLKCVIFIAVRILSNFPNLFYIFTMSPAKANKRKAPAGAATRTKPTNTKAKAPSPPPQINPAPVAVLLPPPPRPTSNKAKAAGDRTKPLTSPEAILAVFEESGNDESVDEDGAIHPTPIHW